MGKQRVVPAAGTSIVSQRSFLPDGFALTIFFFTLFIHSFNQFHSLLELVLTLAQQTFTHIEFQGRNSVGIAKLSDG
jgi:hypothetical protein